jgi:hypothetical protein
MKKGLHTRRIGGLVGVAHQEIFSIRRRQVAVLILSVVLHHIGRCVVCRRE